MLTNINFDIKVTMMIIWAVIFLVTLALELATTNLVSIWFTGGALVAFIISCFYKNWIVQLVIFALVSLVLLIGTRPLVKKKLLKTYRTNADSLIGEDILITKKVSLNVPGEGKIRDIIWTCKVNVDTTIEENTYAEVKEIRGNSLIVGKKEGK